LEARRCAPIGFGDCLMMRLLMIAPLLVIPVLLYGLVALTSGEKGAYAGLQSVWFSMPMISGGRWAFTTGDFILFIGLVMLFIEILKAARTKSDAIANHSVSIILLIVCVVAFLIAPGFGTSVFFLLMIMCVLDVIAGPVVSIVAARRDLGIGEGVNG
jgi:hypothetical protein